ncbi:MAG: arylsulfatase A [Cognaticolwellia sp.]|jgi:arylsulfatase A
MRKINLITIIQVSLCCFLTTTCAARTDKNQSTEISKPNIIYIMADDLGYGHVGYQGQKLIPTPQIDKLAAQGMQFTQAYSGSTVCAPSRSVLMTGQHTGHTPVRGNFGPEGGRVPINAESITIAEVLKSAGYTTGMFGKWGLGEPGTVGEPNNQGFDHWYGYLNQHRAHSYYPDYIWRNKDKVEFPENKDGGRGNFVHNTITKEALTFIANNKDQPFFLYVPYLLPHTELAAPADAVAPFKGKFPYQEVASIENRPVVKDALAVYAGMISTLDTDIGKIMDKLSALGLSENTLVIFTSDNGPASEEGMDATYFNGSGPLRGIKRDLYEGGIRVPMVAHWPNKIAAGTKSDALTAMWDVLPTFAELAGVTPPENIDGISIVPTLFGQQQDTSKRVLYWEFQYKKALRQAVRIGNWKAVRNDKKQEIELYNLANDLAEKNNIAAQHPRLIAQARQLFISERSASIYDK